MNKTNTTSPAPPRFHPTAPIGRHEDGVQNAEAAGASFCPEMNMPEALLRAAKMFGMDSHVCKLTGNVLRENYSRLAAIILTEVAKEMDKDLPLVCEYCQENGHNEATSACWHRRYDAARFQARGAAIYGKEAA